MTRSRTPMLFKNQYVANAAARVERSVGGVQMTFLVGRFGDPSTSFPFKTRVDFSLPFRSRLVAEGEIAIFDSLKSVQGASRSSCSTHCLASTEARCPQFH